MYKMVIIRYFLYTLCTTPGRKGNVDANDCLVSTSKVSFYFNLLFFFNIIICLMHICMYMYFYLKYKYSYSYYSTIGACKTRIRGKSSTNDNTTKHRTERHESQRDTFSNCNEEPKSLEADHDVTTLIGRHKTRIR